MPDKKVIYKALEDPALQDSYIDIDEARERILPDGTVLPYRFVHGGFREKQVKFSFCFPPKESYTGRFYQYLSPFPGPDEEMASFNKTGEDDKIAFCLRNGAYFVESNMGSTFTFGSKSDPSMCYKASAAAAEFSRKVAMEYYGCSRPYGYVYGGSGGGYKSMACIENTDAWDGAVPYVIGSPVSLPNTVTMHCKGQRILRHVFPKIVDALDAGGSGDMYEGLNEEEAATLLELTRMGFPPKSWFPEAWGILMDGATPVLLPGVKRKDPTYFDEFWTVPGYEGADPDSSASRDRLVFHSAVKAVHTPVTGIDDNGASNGVDDSYRKMLANGKDAWIELEEIPQGDDLYLSGVAVRMTSGEAAGKQMLLDKIIPNADGKGGILTIGMCYGMADLSQVIGSIRPGDTLVLDNSDYVAIQSYYRHQVPDDLSFHAWDQFRDENGKPVIPQRPEVIGYGYCGTGTVQDGNIQGKVIVMPALMDESSCPWCGDWYRGKIMQTKGSDEDVRVYFMENCMHGDLSFLECNRVTNYVGGLYQALLDISDWVERGIEPQPTTVYERIDNQIIVPETAAKRKGLQPTVQLTVNGSDCARVKAGEKVTLCARMQMPEGAGEITFADFDFEEINEFPRKGTFATPGIIERTAPGEAEAVVEHTYTVPGTYFASVRVKGQRNGDATDSFTQVRNLARARIIVE